MSTTHSSFGQYCISHNLLPVVKEQRLHPALKLAVGAPWPIFQLCPSSQQIPATPLVNRPQCRTFLCLPWAESVDRQLTRWSDFWTRGCQIWNTTYVCRKQHSKLFHTCMSQNLIAKCQINTAYENPIRRTNADRSAFRFKALQTLKSKTGRGWIQV